MCGISGYIGESKNFFLTYQIITKLFEKSESRGVDAAGYWGTEKGIDGGVLYHKEPGRSSDFIRKEVWKIVNKHNPNLLLVHARGASKGVGEPSKNFNNHPFTSTDKSLGLVHNGRVDDLEYHTLKQKYEIRSHCDSEILLRIIESGESYKEEELSVFGDIDSPHRFAGIRDVFSLINEGHMAVAMGERGDNGERRLWLFRNQHRPLWMVDMRMSLGQVFFVSDPSIWNDALQECPELKNISRNQKLIELPTEEVWYFSISTEQKCPDKVQRYRVFKNNIENWEFDGILHKIDDSKKPNFKVITQLNDEDQIIKSVVKPKINSPVRVFDEFEAEEYESEDCWKEFPIDELNQKCDEIIEIANDIKMVAEQLVTEQSIDRQEFSSFLQKLEDHKNDLELISTIINR